MLGRLQVNLQSCIDAYRNLSRRIFSKKRLPVDWRGHVNEKYKTSELKSAIEEIMKDLDPPVDNLLDDGKDRRCRVYAVERRDLKSRADIPQIRLRSQNREQSYGTSSHLSV